MRTRLVQLLATLMVHAAMAVLVVGIVLLAWVAWNDPLGHAYLCDVLGSKVCS